MVPDATAERAEALQPPFSVADAEAPTLTLSGRLLRVSFRDWREQTVVVDFIETVGLRWQEAGSNGPEERDDSAYEIVASAWLKEHLRQRVIEPVERHRHFKLCFNAAGVLEVLATEMRMVQPE